MLPARSTFKFVVEKLKGLREEDDIDDLMSYLPETEAEDPAEKVTYQNMENYCSIFKWRT